PVCLPAVFAALRPGAFGTVRAGVLAGSHTALRSRAFGTVRACVLATSGAPASHRVPGDGGGSLPVRSGLSKEPVARRLAGRASTGSPRTELLRPSPIAWAEEWV